MFESALVGHKLAEDEYDREEPELRTGLVEAQLGLLERRSFAMVVLVSGMDGAGKTEVMHKLSEWVDPRHLRHLGGTQWAASERGRENGRDQAKRAGEQQPGWQSPQREAAARVRILRRERPGQRALARPGGSDQLYQPRRRCVARRSRTHQSDSQR